MGVAMRTRTSPATTRAESREQRGLVERLSAAVPGVVGTIAGITPHILHHIGPIRARR